MSSESQSGSGSGGGSGGGSPRSPSPKPVPPAHANPSTFLNHPALYPNGPAASSTAPAAPCAEPQVAGFHLAAADHTSLYHLFPQTQATEPLGATPFKSFQSTSHLPQASGPVPADPPLVHPPGDQPWPSDTQPNSAQPETPALEIPTSWTWPQPPSAAFPEPECGLSLGGYPSSASPILAATADPAAAPIAPLQQQNYVDENQMEQLQAAALFTMVSGHDFDSTPAVAPVVGVAGAVHAAQAQIVDRGPAPPHGPQQIVGADAENREQDAYAAAEGAQANRGPPPRAVPEPEPDGSRGQTDANRREGRSRVYNPCAMCGVMMHIRTNFCRECRAPRPEPPLRRRSRSNSEQCSDP
jgi:hypothetical protein